MSTQLTARKRQNRELWRVGIFRNGRGKGGCCLFSIDAQLPKLDVAGSIPVSRSIYKEVMLMRNKEMKAALEAFE
jgi:hypothetical protein